MLLLTIISVLNLALLLTFYFKTVAVIYQKARRLLQIIQSKIIKKKLILLKLKQDICESKDDRWFDVNFLKANIPFSQSASNQLVYRNSRLVNLPLNLVVEGDIILVKPGQVINLKCTPVINNKV